MIENSRFDIFGPNRALPHDIRSCSTTIKTINKKSRAYKNYGFSEAKDYLASEGRFWVIGEKVSSTVHPVGNSLRRTARRVERAGTDDR